MAILTQNRDELRAILLDIFDKIHSMWHRSSRTLSQEHVYPTNSEAPCESQSSLRHSCFVQERKESRRFFKLFFNAFRSLSIVFRLSFLLSSLQKSLYIPYPTIYNPVSENLLASRVCSTVPFLSLARTDSKDTIQ